MGRGLGLKQAVELYDTAFTTTFNQLKQSELIGGQKKLDVNHNGKIDADDLKKIREDKAPVAEEKKAEKEECDCGGTCAACKAKAEKEEKTAAYYEGIVERAREYGLTDAQTLEIVKEAGLANAAGEAVTNTLTRGKTALKSFGDDAKKLVKKHPKVSAGLGATAVGGTAFAAGRGSVSDKTANIDPALLQQLQRQTGSTYNPHSAMDRVNLERVQQHLNPYSTREYRQSLQHPAASAPQGLAIHPGMGGALNGLHQAQNVANNITNPAQHAPSSSLTIGSANGLLNGINGAGAAPTPVNPAANQSMIGHTGGHVSQPPQQSSGLSINPMFASGIN